MGNTVCEEIYRLVPTNVQELQVLQIYSYLYLRMDFTARRLVLSEMVTYMQMCPYGPLHILHTYVRIQYCEILYTPQIQTCNNDFRSATSFSHQQTNQTNGTCPTHQNPVTKPNACSLTGMHPNTQRLQERSFIIRDMIRQPLREIHVHKHRCEESIQHNVLIHTTYNVRICICSTVDLEIFVVKIFSWAALTTKIKNTK